MQKSASPDQTTKQLPKARPSTATAKKPQFEGKLRTLKVFHMVYRLEVHGIGILDFVYSITGGDSHD